MENNIYRPVPINNPHQTEIIPHIEVFDRQQPVIAVQYQRTYGVDLESDAAYYIAYDVIVIGCRAAGASKEGIKGILKHEKSHALFTRLSEKDQEKLTQLVLVNNFSGLQEFYLLLRSHPVYTLNQFDFDLRTKAVPKYIASNGRRKVLKTEIEGTTYGKKENIDAVSLFDEVLAYGQMNIFDHKMPAQVHNIIQKAQSILSSMPPEFREILKRNDILEIDVEEEMRSLFSDSEFIVDTKAAQKAAESVGILAPALKHTLIHPNNIDKLGLLPHEIPILLNIYLNFKKVPLFIKKNE